MGGWEGRSMRGVREEYDRKTGRLEDWRTGGLEDWRTGGLEDWTGEGRRMRGGREKRVIVFNTYLVHRCLLLCT